MAVNPLDKDEQNPLRRTLSRGFTLAVVIGGVIGLGILRTPGEVAAVVSDPLLFVSLWVLGGLFILLSMTVVAELMAMTPRSGGTYPLVRRAYGPFPGFVLGWVDWLSFVGDIALKAIVVTEFAAMLIPEVHQYQTPLAIMVSSAFAALQLRGLALSAKIQEVAAATMALIIIGFTLALLFAESPAIDQATSTPDAVSGLGAWSIMIASIIYTYDGWTNAAYFSGEIKGGGGAVARSSIKGVIVVIVLYVGLMSALAFRVPLTSLAGKELALADALGMVVSPTASTIVLVAAIVILLAYQNLLYLGTPRILQALAVDGLALGRAAKISRGGNPVFAVLLSWGLSVALIVLAGFRIDGFHFLLHLSIFFYLFIYVFVIAGVIILRSRQPDADRPYRAWGHPWSTYICLFIWFGIGLLELVVEYETAAYAAIMVAIAWPVYWRLARSRSK